MSGDIETLLRETARTARPSGLPATPSDLRRQGDRRRALRRGGTAVVAVALVGGIAVGLSGLPGASSTSPIGSGTSGATSATVLPEFPVPPSLSGRAPTVPRTTGRGPGQVAANLTGTTTTYFTCVGGGLFRLTLEGGPDPANATAWESGSCSGDVDSSTVTYRTGAANAVIRIMVPPGATWAVQVVPGTESAPPSTPAAVSHTAVAPVTASRPCAGSDLRVSETGDVAAAGSAQAVLVFRNVGTVACWLRGYPTVLAEGTNPSSVLRATPALTANLGGGSAVVSTIPIAPGQAGSATLQWGDNPAGDVTTCLSSPVFAVTPPGTSTVTRLQSPAYVGVCFAPEVLPVVAGTQGTVPAP